MSRSKKVTYYANKPRMLVINDGTRMDLNTVRGYGLAADGVTISFKDDIGDVVEKTFADGKEAEKYIDALDKYYQAIDVPDDDDDD